MDRQFFAELFAVERHAIASELARCLARATKDSTGFDRVTEADRAAERAQSALIEERFPEYGIWGRGLDAMLMPGSPLATPTW